MTKDNQYIDFAKLVNIDPEHPIFERVFIHRSYINENRKKNLEHNERLEFLGDAVLELVVTEYLYSNFPNPEGELTNWRSAIVKGEMLSKVAKHLGMNDLMKLSRGEKSSTGKSRDLILANAFEALIGAIFLISGYADASKFIFKYLIAKLPKIIEEGSFIDAKSKLQEIIQDKQSVTPIYKVISESGPDHDKRFEVGVYIGEKLSGKGSGSSKRNAEQDAAKKAIELIDKAS